MFVELLIAALLVAISYLIGGIPAAYWDGRLQCGVDIREHGNDGTVNAVRTLGWRSGLLVLAADVAQCGRSTKGSSR